MGFHREPLSSELMTSYWWHTRWGLFFPKGSAGKDGASLIVCIRGLVDFRTLRRRPSSRRVIRMILGGSYKLPDVQRAK
jgi:hypothetical protein